MSVSIRDALLTFGYRMFDVTRRSSRVLNGNWLSFKERLRELFLDDLLTQETLPNLHATAL